MTNEELLARIQVLEQTNEAQWNRLQEFAANLEQANIRILQHEAKVQTGLSHLRALMNEVSEMNELAMRTLNQARSVVNDSYGELFALHIKAWWNDMVAYRTPQLLNLIHNRIHTFNDRHGVQQRKESSLNAKITIE